VRQKFGECPPDRLASLVRSLGVAFAGTARMRPVLYGALDLPEAVRVSVVMILSSAASMIGPAKQDQYD
jgi:hypothetical protein